MPETRKIVKTLVSRPTMEGAGVSLRRGFGFGETELFDPFLLFDDFRSADPREYSAGFPWHPHRGIETITYMLEGSVEHGDSLGNSGSIGPGDVQWMTAGSGIIHQEMPKGDAQGRMGGFQLWANLPARAKMMAPRYRDITASQIPETALEGGGRVRVVCGEAHGLRGPVDDVLIEPRYLDVRLPSGGAWTLAVSPDHTVIAYVFDGEGVFEPEGGPFGIRTVLVFGKGGEVSVTASARGVGFLLFCGKPLGEPVAWRGPIVMNTQEELRKAFEEYEDGSFLKHAGSEG